MGNTVLNRRGPLRTQKEGVELEMNWPKGLSVRIKNEGFQKGIDYLNELLPEKSEAERLDILLTRVQVRGAQCLAELENGQGSFELLKSDAIVLIDEARTQSERAAVPISCVTLLRASIHIAELESVSYAYRVSRELEESGLESVSDFDNSLYTEAINGFYFWLCIASLVLKEYNLALEYCNRVDDEFWHRDKVFLELVNGFPDAEIPEEIMKR